MPIKKILYTCAAVLLLQACQTTAPSKPLPQRLEEWRGASFDELVQAWGLPARQSFETETGFAEWQAAQTKSGPSISLGLGGFGSNVGGSVGTTIYGDETEERCVLQVQFDANKTATQLTPKGPTELCDRIVSTRYH
ncbi:hypothetical protein [Echinimonas agarilytica]|uniref:Lipoprotein n=1 Tax=Echinimonas agarilytica TaxID=1215918 RepID=A0AA42B7G0_9GAMM|nr:hypothetical protein [Echinimonas agarilytica]MCM2679777.1 hypothetical protein [Echinimonas agarilytica]